jgi:hypothetical protein
MRPPWILKEFQSSVQTQKYNLEIIAYNPHTIKSFKSVFLFFSNCQHRCKNVKRATKKSLRQECHDYKWDLLPWHRRHWSSHGQSSTAEGQLGTRERLIAPGGPTHIFSSTFFQHPKVRTHVDLHRALSQEPPEFTILFFLQFFSRIYY